MEKQFLARPFTMPWGEGMIIEEARYRGRYHEPAIQLLEYENGELAIRFAYYHRGRFQRSPLMLRPKEFKLLRRSLRETPRLRKLLQKLVTA